MSTFSSSSMNPSSRPSDSAAIRFVQTVMLSKREAFETCEACAEAERALLRVGRVIEAARLASVFELIEGRLVCDT